MISALSGNFELREEFVGGTRGEWGKTFSLFPHFVKWGLVFGYIVFPQLPYQEIK
jgi:hypothetical protein